jgi:hypothetical protein
MWVVALYGSLHTAAEWLCERTTPKRLSDRELLKHVCPGIWFLLSLAALSTAWFLQK